MQTESEGLELIIILALVAGFIIFQLRRTLGKKTGYDPTKDQENGQRGNSYSRRDTQDREEDPETEKVVSIRPELEQPTQARNLGLDKSSPFYGIIEKINQYDHSFTLQNFFDGAEYAYGLILNSFWSRDKKTLRSMLSREVYDQFDGVIGQQESQKLQNENKLMDIEKIDLVDASLSGSMAEVTVEFTSHMIMALRDEDDRIIEGNEKKPIRVSDIWTFCRDVKSSDPNWTLVATRTA